MNTGDSSEVYLTQEGEINRFNHTERQYVEWNKIA